MKQNKTVLAGINASYSHTALSVYSLARMPVNTELAVHESTINEDIDTVYRSLMEEKAQCIAFSCYIWNIERVLLLARRIKAARPETQILLGGPEVSYDCEAWMRKHPEIDRILSGEGEYSFPMLFTDSPSDVPGLWHRMGSRIISPKNAALIPNLYALPPVYRDFPFQANKMYYYEASRGCPYHCAFCLSSQERLRTVPLSRVREELQYLLDARVMLVKFVDRTMNADPARFREILTFLSEQDNGVTKFHMEIHPAALKEREIRQIGRLRKGLVQFEIGIQSTNPETCAAIQRVGENAQIQKTVAALLENGNAHLHLDLIAGLPFEDLDAFGRSFNDVMEMRPHQLQLGFLKLLRGTELRRKAPEYSIRYAPDAPYEVLATQWMSPEALFFLKDVEGWVEILYNDAPWKKTLLYLKHLTGDWWTLFSDLAGWAASEKITPVRLNREDVISVLFHFGITSGAKEEILRELLLYDTLLVSRTPPRSDILQTDRWNAEDFLESHIQETIPLAAREDPKPWYRKTRAQHFSHAVHGYDGKGEPAREPNQLLFIYNVETAVVPIRKGA